MILCLLLVMILCLSLSSVAMAEKPLGMNSPDGDEGIIIPIPGSSKAPLEGEMQDVYSYGQCGDNLTWTLDNEGLLTVSGSGDMWDYPSWSNCNERITSIVLPDGLTRIGDHAFYACSKITSVELPESLSSIGEWAFIQCSNLRNVTIPLGVTKIGDSAFQECSSLNSITIPASVETLGDSAFHSCSNLESVVISKGLTSIGVATFEYCTSLTSVILPDSLTSIGNAAFAYCENLKDITIPRNVITIGQHAFAYCSNLSEVSIPSGVEIIDTCAFFNCSNLVKVDLPDRITSINNQAFSSCSSLKAITIPRGVTSIEFRAFWGCTNLAEIRFEGNAPTFGMSPFYKVNATAYYPAGNETWTDSVLDNYGGTITWVPYSDGTIIIESTQARPGDQIALQVSLTANPGIFAMRFNVTYDTTLLRFLGVEDGSLSGWIADTDTNGIIWESSSVVDTFEKDCVVKLRFQVLDSDQDCETTITLSGKEAINSRGEDVFFDVDPATVKIIISLPGDVNDDGSVDILDLVRMRKYIINNAVSINFKNADLNSDDSVNLKDLLMIRKILVGVIC